jgi:hypothetical protein
VRVARWSGDRCDGGIRAASPARPSTGEVVGPWWASVGLRTRREPALGIRIKNKSLGIILVIEL